MDEKIKVVVADDIKILAIRMQSIISGHPKVEKVWTAFDGEEEIIQIMKLEPDLVFTDMQMPKRTGVDVIEAIRCYPSVRKKPKFVVITGDRDASLIQKSRELGFDIEYKPISDERIIQYLDEANPIEIDEEEENRRFQEDLKIMREELRKWRFSKKNKEKKENSSD